MANNNPPGPKSLAVIFEGIVPILVLVAVGRLISSNGPVISITKPHWAVVMELKIKILSNRVNSFFIIENFKNFIL